MVRGQCRSQWSGVSVIVSGQWLGVSGQVSVVSGQWPVASVQGSLVMGQWSGVSVMGKCHGLVSVVNEIAHETCYDKYEEQRSGNKWKSTADAAYPLRNPYAPS